MFLLAMLLVATLQETIDRIRVAVDSNKIIKQLRTASQLKFRVELTSVRWRVAKKLLEEVLNQVIRKKEVVVRESI